LWRRNPLLTCNLPELGQSCTIGFWSGRRRSLLAGLATVVVIVSLLALPPVRAAADQLLQVFRLGLLVNEWCADGAGRRPA
jgi:hypothetical protein